MAAKPIERVVMLLPAFESIEVCPKCGHARWRPGFPEMGFFALRYVSAAGGLPEHLAVSCRACEYSWPEAVQPSADGLPSLTDEELRRWGILADGG